MSNPHRISQTTEAWNRSIRFDYKKAFVTLGKLAVDAGTGSWKNASKDVLELVNAASVRGKGWKEQAWTWITRAMLRAMIQLIEEADPHRPYMEQAPLSSRELEDLSAELDATLGDVEVTVDRAFFRDPGRLELVQPVAEALERWLVRNGWTDVTARHVGGRLRSRFRLTVHEEWAANAADYAKVPQAVGGPAAEASETEMRWLRYRAYLRTLPHETVFEESFSFKDIYVPLRVHRTLPSVIRKRLSDGKIETVFLDDHLDDWLKEIDPEDCLRVVQGGPGCGKSTCARMLAARLADDSGCRPVLIPLQRFTVDRDLMDSLERFCDPDRNACCPPNPFQDRNENELIMLIFDGLDELSEAGSQGTEIANEFVGHVQDSLRNLNLDQVRIKIVITGRDLSIQGQSNIQRAPDKVLHVLPYQIPKQLIKELGSINDPSNILKKDQRHQWWEKYARATGRDWSGMPETLDTEHLDPLTAQPLLNYLVALLYQDDKYRQTIETSTNLNGIYNALLSRIHERPWGGATGRAPCGHPCDTFESMDEFRDTFAAIAIAAWHGGEVRRTTRRQIARSRDREVWFPLKPRLDVLDDDSDQGLYRLLTAFYCRESSARVDGEKAIEFTHKTFGEYLVAQGICRFLERLTARVNEGEWTANEALLKWALLFGPSPLDDGLERFLVGEIRTLSPGTAVKAQQTLAKLIDHMLAHGMPMHKLGTGLDYQNMCSQARNAEETLLVILSLCARTTRKCSIIPYFNKFPATLGRWITHLVPEPSPPSVISLILRIPVPFAYRHLDYISASHQQLWYADLRGGTLDMTDFERSDLRKANLERTEFNKAKLNETDLREAILFEATLEKANLKDADLRKAVLAKANLKGAILVEADLREANLRDAVLREANIRNADLRGAILGGAKLGKANLERANLESTDLRGAELKRTNLKSANLIEADLKGAELERAELEKAKLKGAQARGAKLQEANLKDANLTEADIRGTNLRKAKLNGAILRGVNLEGAKLGKAILENANLRESNLTGAKLRDANMNGADLRGAKLDEDALTKEQWAQVAFRPEDPLD